MSQSKNSSAVGNVVNLSDSFDQMDRDYRNPATNRYVSGPGAKLDTDLQPGALASAVAAAAASASEMSYNITPAVKIRLKNTRDLTEEGLQELCRPYGTVVSVHKPRLDKNIAFVEFANQCQAGFAIQELSQKLGFQFYPAFAHEKRTLNILEASKLPVPPPPFASAANEVLQHASGINASEESWERTMVQRRIKSGFSIPLQITFPKPEPLATGAHYNFPSGTQSYLARIDPDQLFNIGTLVESDHYESKKLNDPKIRDRIENLVKRKDVNRLMLDSESNQNKPVYVHRGLPEEHRHLFPDTRCIACGSRGFFKCGICAAPYCSAHCQQLDYPSHKENCDPSEGDENVNGKKGTFEDLDELCLTKEPFPKGSHVTILSVLTPERVFVRSLDKTSNKEYLQTISDVAKAGLTAKKIENDPEPGDICLALYEPLNIYARVLITKVRKRQAHCVYIDIGLVKRINFNELRGLKTDELRLRKVRIHKIHLKGITEEHGHIEKAMAYLNGLIDQPMEMKAELEGGNIVDAVLRTATGVNVNQKINQLIVVPVINTHETTEEYVDYKTLPTKPLPTNATIDIVVINRTTVKLDFRVTVIAYDDLPYLQDLQKKLQCYGKKVEKFTEHYTPRLNEVCLVRNMDIWYRAVLLETVGDGRPTVFLCDYGCLLMARLENIRKLPPSLAMEVRTTDAKVYSLDKAYEAGVKIDSEFLDIYLEENERMTVETSEEVEFKEFGEALSKEDTTMLAVIKVPDLVSFVADRTGCDELMASVRDK